MAKWEKLLERLYRLDMSVRFEELTKILKTFGYLPNETLDKNDNQEEKHESV